MRQLFDVEEEIDALDEKGSEKVGNSNSEVSAKTANKRRKLPRIRNGGIDASQRRRSVLNEDHIEHIYKESEGNRMSDRHRNEEVVLPSDVDVMAHLPGRDRFVENSGVWRWMGHYEFYDNVVLFGER